MSLTREKPQQPPSAFIMWLKAEGMQAVKEKIPNASCAKIVSFCADAWAKLDPNIKGEYEANFEKAKERWFNDCRIWHEVGHCGHSQLDTIPEDIKDYAPTKGVDNLNNITTACPQIGHIEHEKLKGTDIIVDNFDSLGEEGEVKPVKQRNKDEKIDKRAKYTAAAKDWARGKFSSVAACARAHGVDRRILHEGVVKRGGEFRGSGQTSSVLENHEEEMIVRHVKHMAEIGYGASWITLKKLIQEILLSLKSANPNRITGLEDQGQLPSQSWVRRFAAQNNLVLRKSSVISKGRALITPENLDLWFSDVGRFLASKADLMAAMIDPRRVFNQDETTVELGVGSQWVLVE